MKKEIIIVNSIVFLWCIGIIMPALSIYLLGSSSLFSKAGYGFYHTVCHQFESRSFFIAGNKFAVCERCTSIYFSFFIGLLSARFGFFTKASRLSPVWILCIASAPMIADGAVSLFTLYESNVISRVVTGTIFGFGLSLILRQSLVDIISSISTYSHKKFYGIKSR